MIDRALASAAEDARLFIHCHAGASRSTATAYLALIRQYGPSEAEAAFARIAAEGTASYRHLARVREAVELAHTDAKAAIAAYDQIESDGSVGPMLQDLAGVRAAAMLIDAGAFDEARRRLEPLAGSDRVFRHTARELLVLATWRAGDAAATKRWVDLIMSDAQTPPAARSRVEMLVALGAGQGSS